MSARATPLRPGLATLAYVAVVGALIAVAAGAVSGVLERRGALAEAESLLDRLQGRRPMLPATPGAAAGAVLEGSPFLDGPTLTIAGADLMQRLTGAVTRYGGRIISSRVELGGTPYGAGYLAVSANLDIAQPELQKLLYDLEAGMPFLFVGQLVVQGRGAAADGREEAREDDRVRVTMTVYGQWRGPR